jgi:hypothetical protein
VTYGLVQQRSKCGLADLLESGEFHAAHGEPARGLPTSACGQQTRWVGDDPGLLSHLRLSLVR